MGERLTFQWGGGVFQMGGFIFKWGMRPMVGFDRGGFERNVRWGVSTHPPAPPLPPLWETLPYN